VWQNNAEQPYTIQKEDEKLLELYRKDIVADKYHFYKLENVKVSHGSNTELFMFNYGGLNVKLNSIQEVFPFEVCDIHFSMKSTGSYYNGTEGDENALYLDQIIVVKKK